MSIADRHVDAEVAYLAGFIDGEGSIQLARGRWIKARNGYTLHLSAKQVHPEPLRMLAARYGGRVIPVTPSQPGRLKHYRWGIVTRDAERALREMLPYLRVKAAQARLALDCRLTFLAHGSRNRNVDEWLLAERDAYCEAMRLAKRLEYA